MLEEDSVGARSDGATDFRSLIGFIRLLMSISFSSTVSSAAMNPARVPPSISMSLPNSSMSNGSLRTACHFSQEGTSLPEKAGSRQAGRTRKWEKGLWQKVILLMGVFSRGRKPRGLVLGMMGDSG